MATKVLILVLGIILGLGVWAYKSYHHKCTNLNLKNLDNKNNIIPIAIIGGGPAGLSAALYTSRGCFRTVVFSGPDLGGQLTRTLFVENWPGTEHTNGTEIMKVVRKQAEKFGALIANDTVTKVDFSTWPFVLETESGDKVNALSVIIATGGLMKKLGIPGEDEYLGKGVAVCGICDAALYKDKEVIVVGGGDAAIQEAMLLAVNAKKVTLVVAGPKLRATACMQERLLDHKNVEVIYNSRVTKITGDKTQVTGTQILNESDKSTKDYAVSGVFVGIGQIPNTEIFKSQISLDKNGYIELCGRTQDCSVCGIFAGGSCCEGRWTQAAVSSGDCIKAALSAMDFLTDNDVTDIYLKKFQDKYYTPKDLVADEK